MLDKSEMYFVILPDDDTRKFSTLEDAEKFMTAYFNDDRDDKFPMFICKTIARYDVVRPPILKLEKSEEA